MNPYANPYAPPQGGELYAPPAAQGDTGVVPDAIIEPLRATRPWVIFLAIVGFLLAGLFVLGGLAAFAVGGFAGTGKTEPLVMVGAGIFYFVLGAIVVPPSVGMLRYGMSIGTLVREPRMTQLTQALDRQRGYWKLVGIITAILIALYPIGIIVMVVVIGVRGVK